MLNQLDNIQQDVNVIRHHDDLTDDVYLFSNQEELDQFIRDRQHFDRSIRHLRTRDIPLANDSTNEIPIQTNNLLQDETVNETIDIDSLEPHSTHTTYSQNSYIDRPIVAYPINTPIAADNIVAETPYTNPTKRDPHTMNPDEPTHTWWCIRFADSRAPFVCENYTTAMEYFIDERRTVITGHTSRRSALGQMKIRLTHFRMYVEWLERNPIPDMNQPPVDQSLLEIIPSPFLASPENTIVIESVGEDLKTNTFIYARQIIGTFRGNKLSLKQLNSGGHSSRYLLILDDDHFLVCDEYANSNPCRCLMSKSNDAFGLYHTLEHRMLSVDDNNAAYHYDSITDQAILYAIRDILPDEIILWCYDPERLAINSLQVTPSYQTTFTSPRVALQKGMQRFIDRIDVMENNINAENNEEIEPLLAFGNTPLLPAYNTNTIDKYLQPTPPRRQRYYPTLDDTSNFPIHTDNYVIHEHENFEQSINESKANPNNPVALNHDQSVDLLLEQVATHQNEVTRHFKNIIQTPVKVAPTQIPSQPVPPTIDLTAEPLTPEQLCKIERNHQRARIRKRSIAAANKYISTQK